MPFMEVSVVLLTLFLNLVGTALSLLTDGMGMLSGTADWVGFGVQSGATACTPETCPGSQFSPIAAAWANIGYITHSDILNYISATNFGLWAPLLYVCAALAALVGVAINMPMRSYMWFMLGPAFYAFLVETTTQVQGVDWVVANQPQDLTDVWRDAEVGLANTDGAAERGIVVNGRDGPSGTYSVAYPMVFLDELFSATTNLIVEWLGVYRHEGTGAANSNLASVEGSPDGPWYLLSSLKWSMLENIVGVSLRSPDFRDALVTFLGSECGDAFKKGIDSGKYIAASSPYGKKEVSSVLKGREANRAANAQSEAEISEFKDFTANLDTVWISSPRSLTRVLNEGNAEGQFGGFAPVLNKMSEQSYYKEGRTQMIVCTEYLYAIIQMLRFEAGHWYWQMLRSCPNGLTRDQCLRALFYGWDVREQEGQPYADKDQMNVFVKNLIMTYILRNELLYAPQITEVNQRFAPSEQSRSFSEAYVRTMGSKSKYQELYNWAVLMPHMQGILVYFLLIAYPFAAMVMVLPGYYKIFLTWVSFFAWVKLWDVGFAVVNILERSVWAMIGNTTKIGSMANTLIQMNNMNSGIGVGCAGSNVISSKKLSEDLCGMPKVCSVDFPHADECSGTGTNQEDANAWDMLDKLLILGAGADLDLANGYYIYIMAALYFAVPAVTGQLVLGAKAGAASMLNSAIGGVSGEAGKAAMTGYQHQASNQALTNSGIIGQAAYGKAMKAQQDGGGSLAGNIFAAQHDPLRHENDQAAASLKKARLGADASVAENDMRSFDKSAGLAKSLGSMTHDGIKDALGPIADRTKMPPYLKKFLGLGENTPGPNSGVVGNQQKGSGLERTGGIFLDAGSHEMGQKFFAASAKAGREGAFQDGMSTYSGLMRSGASSWAQNMKSAGDYEGQMAVWEAKNQFASHVSAMAGIAGMNTGALNPGQKPTDLTGMAMSGELSSKRKNGENIFTYDSQGTGTDGVRYTDTASGGFLTAVDTTKLKHDNGMASEVRQYDQQTPAEVVQTAVENGPGFFIDVFTGGKK